MKIGLIIYMIRGCVIFMKETSLKPVICLVIGYIYLHVTRRTECTTLAFTVALNRFLSETCHFFLISIFVLTFI